MPATMEEATLQILDLFDQHWSALHPTIPVVAPNTPVPDSVRSSDSNSGKAYARIHIQHNDGRQSSTGSSNGSRRFRHTGLVTVELNSPSYSGVSGPSLKATDALNAFRGKTTSGGVTFMRPRPREIGSDGTWYRVDALVEFTYDEVVT